jgi:hypothetical protein
MICWFLGGAIFGAFVTIVVLAVADYREADRD